MGTSDYRDELPFDLQVDHVYRDARWVLYAASALMIVAKQAASFEARLDNRDTVTRVRFVKGRKCTTVQRGILRDLVGSDHWHRVANDYARLIHFTHRANQSWLPITNELLASLPSDWPDCRVWNFVEPSALLATLELSRRLQTAAFPALRPHELPDPSCSDIGKAEGHILKQLQTQWTVTIAPAWREVPAIDFDVLHSRLTAEESRVLIAPRPGTKRKRPTLTRDQEVALKYIRDHPGCQPKNIKQATGVHLGTISKWCAPDGSLTAYGVYKMDGYRVR
ncbi:MAG: hypothetical protein IT436_12375 [Phycisphaerales bacterium]|nr:hypothetical protein [Phycisphaerales bacterium]